MELELVYLYYFRKEIKWGQYKDCVRKEQALFLAPKHIRISFWNEKGEALHQAFMVLKSKCVRIMYFKIMCDRGNQCMALMTF